MNGDKPYYNWVLWESQSTKTNSSYLPLLWDFETFDSYDKTIIEWLIKTLYSRFKMIYSLYHQREEDGHKHVTRWTWVFQSLLVF